MESYVRVLVDEVRGLTDADILAKRDIVDKIASLTGAAYVDTLLMLRCYGGMENISYRDAEYMAITNLVYGRWVILECMADIVKDTGILDDYILACYVLYTRLSIEDMAMKLNTHVDAIIQSLRRIAGTANIVSIRNESKLLYNKCIQVARERINGKYYSVGNMLWLILYNGYSIKDLSILAGITGKSIRVKLIRYAGTSSLKELLSNKDSYASLAIPCEYADIGTRASKSCNNSSSGRDELFEDCNGALADAFNTKLAILDAKEYRVRLKELGTRKIKAKIKDIIEYRFNGVHNRSSLVIKGMIEHRLCN